MTNEEIQKFCKYGRTYKHWVAYMAMMTGNKVNRQKAFATSIIEIMLYDYGGASHRYTATKSQFETMVRNIMAIANGKRTKTSDR